MEFFRLFYMGLRVSDTHIQLKVAMRYAEQAAWCREHGFNESARKCAHSSGLVLRNPNETLA